jgi:hypothetical protein
VNSRRQQIRTLALNGTLGKYIRAVDAVLDAYTDSGALIEEESEHVVKLALMLLLTNYFDADDIVILADSSSFRIPKSLSESSQFDIRCMLSGKGDPDAPPDPDEGNHVTLKRDPISGALRLEDKEQPT